MNCGHGEEHRTFSRGVGAVRRCAICQVEKVKARRQAVGASAVIKAEDVAHFWTYVQRSTNDECWPWLGHRNQKGYGRFRHAMKQAHRIAYELLIGSVGDNYLLRDCESENCVNPWHWKSVDRRTASRFANASRMSGPAA